MPKILVIGATGYIGRALCASLLRSGNHTVYGLARSQSKARELAGAEVHPVAGSATDSAAYTALIQDAHIDVVIDVAGVREGGARAAALQVLNDVRVAGRERLARAKSMGVPRGGPRLGFVHTSGVWVHGATKPGQDINDLDPVGVEGYSDPAPRVGWRVAVEKEVLEASEDLDVAVVRPGVVYGASSWVFSAFFEQLHQAANAVTKQTVALPLARNSMVATVHVDDVGAGLHALVDKLPLIAGTGVWPVFDFTSHIEPLGSIMVSAGKAMGVDEDAITFTSFEDNPLGGSMSTSTMTNSGRAKTLLGWDPKRNGMLSNMQTYIRAWTAHRPE